jgi:arylsulfatase A-like enzyme
LRPHVAWVVPTAYYGQYPLEKFHPAAADPEPMKNAPVAAYSTQPPNFGLTGDKIKSCLRAYYASTTFMDKQVGRVFAALKDLGLEDNTVVVFWGDHGYRLEPHADLDGCARSMIYCVNETPWTNPSLIAAS